MIAPQYKPGDRVVVSARGHRGHHRTPLYLKGRPAVVELVLGAFRDPELLAYHKPGLPRRVLYRLQFRQADLWPGYAGPEDDMLTAEIYEHWLEPAPAGARG